MLRKRNPFDFTEEEENQTITVADKKITLTEKEIKNKKLKDELHENKWNDAYIFPAPSFFWDYFRNIDKWELQHVLHSHSESRRANMVEINRLEGLREIEYKTKEQLFINKEMCIKRWLISLRPHFKNLVKCDYDIELLPPSSSFAEDPKQIKNELKGILCDLENCNSRINDIMNELNITKREKDAHNGVICAKIDNEILKERIKRTKNLNTDAMFRVYEKNEKMLKEIVKTLSVAAIGQTSKENTNSHAVLANGFEQLKGNKATSTDDELKMILKSLVASEKKEIITDEIDDKIKSLAIT